MNQTTIDNFISIRKYLLLSSKIVGIIFCIYYIKNTANYKITWPIIEFLFPQRWSSLLSTIGTSILIIPLTILVTSLLLPQNNTLHVLSCLFGTMGILLTLIKSTIFKQPFGEITSFRFMTVQKILTLPEKREIFQQEFIRIVNENYISMIKTYEHLMSKLNTDYLIKYDTILNTLKTSSQIKQYASEVIINLTKELAINTTTNTSANTQAFIIKVLIGVTGTVIIIWLLNKYLFGDNTLDLQTQHAAISKDIATLGKDTTILVGDVAINTSTLNNNLTKITEEVIKINARLDTITKDTLNHSEALNTYTSLFSKLWTKISNIENNLPIN